MDLRAEIMAAPVLDEALLRRAKRAGLSDRQIAALRPELAGEDGVRTLRHRLGLRPVYKTVDTCAAEFAATTPYHYSSYDEETEVAPSDRPKVLILGSGPNRIGQGIEFDYSCVHAVQALRAVDFETVMVNCNPETVSTDYDTADRLYFEPLTFEDVLEVWHAEDSSGRAAGGPGVVGVIVQLGGQTPLGLAQRLKDAGVPIVGTSPESINLAEDRGAFGAVLAQAGLPAPAYGTATSFAGGEEDRRRRSGTRCWSAPPTCSAGAAWRSSTTTPRCVTTSVGPPTSRRRTRYWWTGSWTTPSRSTWTRSATPTATVYLGGVMEHIEEAGIHSGDSSCALPPITLGSAHLAAVRRYTAAIAHGVGVRGLLNVQYALKDDSLYVLEANPRASRTVPFVSKATAVPLAKAAARIMLGATIADLRAEGVLRPVGDGADTPDGAPIAVKEAVLPFKRFRTPAGKGVDSLLGPEMKSTGEVMGIDTTFGHAFAKSQAAAYGSLPVTGRILVTVANRDKRGMIFPVKRLADLGFEIVATEGTGGVLRRHGIPCEIVAKHYETGEQARNAVGLISSGEVALVINTPQGAGGRQDGYEIRSAAVAADIPCITTVPGASAAVMGIEALIRGEMSVRPLQELHAALRSLDAR